MLYQTHIFFHFHGGEGQKIYDQKSKFGNELCRGRHYENKVQTNKRKQKKIDKNDTILLCDSNAICCGGGF